MSKSNVQSPVWKQKIDRFWAKTLLSLIPKAVRPNHLSLLRLLLVPLIILCLMANLFPAALILFIAAALLDSLDGALARQRRIFSPKGLILDPIADKLLIIATGWFLIYIYPFKIVIAVMVLMDIFIALLSGLALLNVDGVKRDISPSNFWGKGKMALQTAGLLLIFVWLIFSGSFWLYLSEAVIIASLFFQTVSLISYLQPAQKKS